MTDEQARAIVHAIDRLTAKVKGVEDSLDWIMWILWAIAIGTCAT